MEAKLYMPYFGYNDNFDAEGTYKSEDEYIKAMQDAYNSTKDAITNFMLDNPTTNLTGTDGAAYSFGQNETKNEKIIYAPCDVTLTRRDGKPEDVDGLITHFAAEDEFTENVLLSIENATDDFQSEFFMWLNEHESVLANGAKFGTDWCWEREPKRELKLEFKNLANETVYAKLINCKLLDVTSKNKVTLFIEKIDLIDSID